MGFRAYMLVNNAVCDVLYFGEQEGLYVQYAFGAPEFTSLFYWNYSFVEYKISVLELCLTDLEIIHITLLWTAILSYQGY